MYQIEVKRWLVTYRFPPSEGWRVTVDVDAMERAHGGQHTPDKAERAANAEEALLKLGTTIAKHHKFGRVDIVAEHSQHGTYIVEVEGDSSRQKEQATYSALGQLLLQMDGTGKHFILALPDKPVWERQARKVPEYSRRLLNLTCVLISESGIREIMT